MIEFFKNIVFFRNYTKHKKIYIFLIFLCSILSIIFSIIAPIHSAEIIVALTENEFIRVIAIALIILIVDVMEAFSNYISNRCLIKFYQDSLNLLERDLGLNIFKLKNEFLDSINSGILFQRLTNDTSQLAISFGSLLKLITKLIKYIGILVAIFIINKFIFAFVFIGQIILYFIEKNRTDKRNIDDTKTRKAEEKVTGLASEMVSGTRDIKMLNIEKFILKIFSKSVNDACYKKWEMEKNSWNYKVAMQQISNLQAFILIVLIIIFMEKGVLLPVTALIICNFTNAIYGYASLLGDLLENIKSFNLSCKRINEIIAIDGFPKEKFGIKHIDSIAGQLEFKNVKFDYKDTNRKVLKDLSFKVSANETVALVGKNGAGKVTIFNLLCKMYDADDGSITIDGIDINDLDKDSIRGNISIISDQPYFFNMSIKDNLKLANPSMTDAEMKKCCSIAGFDTLIKELPEGYNTIIGERGYNLSSSYKQRLAIARALIQKTKIILFDESANALDKTTQEKILKTIYKLKKDYTIIIIARRLSTLNHVDRILYIENGHIIAEGKHEDLIKCCKSYKKFYEEEIIKD